MFILLSESLCCYQYLQVKDDVTQRMRWSIVEYGNECCQYNAAHIIVHLQKRKDMAHTNSLSDKRGLEVLGIDGACTFFSRPAPTARVKKKKVDLHVGAGCFGSRTRVKTHIPSAKWSAMKHSTSPVHASPSSKRVMHTPLTQWRER